MLCDGSTRLVPRQGEALAFTGGFGAPAQKGCPEHWCLWGAGQGAVRLGESQGTDGWM